MTPVGLVVGFLLVMAVATTMGIPVVSVVMQGPPPTTLQRALLIAIGEIVVLALGSALSQDDSQAPHAQPARPFERRHSQTHPCRGRNHADLLQAIDDVSRPLARSWLATATAVELREARVERPYVPAAPDAAPLTDLSGALNTNHIDASTRRILREHFSLPLDEQS